jgi:colicin import membrane protein
MSHNAFQHGFAKQTDDPRIVAASIARPVVVLKRAVGSSGEFREHTELSRSLPKKKLPKREATSQGNERDPRRSRLRRPAAPKSSLEQAGSVTGAMGDAVTRR